DILCAADSRGRILFQDLSADRMNILYTDAAHLTFVFSPAGDFLMASQDNGMHIDVFSVKDAVKLFTMSSSSVFRSMGFSADGEYAVAFTDDSCITAQRYQDESMLLEDAARLAPGH
ncbi:MAG: hypothetical protein J5859_05420, partial [Clostridia bacterium]|nr:hypothetical protein [Clostridia bacterium]